MIAVALTIWGVFILFRQRVAVTGTKIVAGWPAIVIGSMFVGLFPVFITFGFVLGLIELVLGWSTDSLLRHSYLIELGILFTVIVTAIAIATRYGRTEAELEEAKRLALRRPPVSVPDRPDKQIHNPYRAPRM